jgi:IS66 C-terminal element
MTRLAFQGHPRGKVTAINNLAAPRRNWLFTWTELGAKHVGIIQSLLTTCRLYEITPYDYLVDVLQRVGVHPANRVAELTPRLWKQHFRASPRRSDLYSRVLGADSTGAIKR